MVSRPHPLEVKLDVIDPPPGWGHVYRLGETINVIVRVRPLRDTEVREGRVELVFAREVEGQGDTHVHSSVTFLTDSRLYEATTARYSVRLRVDPEPPPRAAEGTLKWRLVATVEVPGTHDISTERPVKISIGVAD